MLSALHWWGTVLRLGQHLPLDDQVLLLFVPKATPTFNLSTQATGPQMTCPCGRLTSACLLGVRKPITKVPTGGPGGGCRRPLNPPSSQE